MKVAQLVPLGVIYCSCTLNNMLFPVTSFVYLKHQFLCYSRKKILFYMSTEEVTFSKRTFMGKFMFDYSSKPFSFFPLSNQEIRKSIWQKSH